MIDQPPPVPNGHPAVWPMVISDLSGLDLAADLEGVLRNDMREREILGRGRYGTPLQPFNGRDAEVDGYQELLDGCAYYRQALHEGRPVGHIYRELLRLTAEARLVLLERDGR